MRLANLQGISSSLEALLPGVCTHSPTPGASPKSDAGFLQLSVSTLNQSNLRFATQFSNKASVVSSIYDNNPICCHRCSLMP